MNCPRCNGPASDETLREFGGVCPKCLLKFAGEKDAPAFPNLEIVEMIGQGGMGVVYKAVQTNLGRTVALKVLSPQLSSDPEFVERFTREAKALAQLSHPHIVAIHDSGIHDRVPYLVMEYVKGQSLRQLLETKALTATHALELVPQICDALYYAHAKGVVHRDIKPENILLDGEGRVKIADYGLAKIASLDQPRITRTNVAMGTPHYMAPEQIEKTSEVDHRADIYSLGVVIYEMLTGELPLGRFKPPSERATIDRRLDRVVLKSLEKEPADRYQSADEVKSQIAGLDQAPGAAPTGPRLSKLAVTSGILCLHGLAAMTIAIILMVVDHVIPANVVAAAGIALLLASIGFSVAAFFVILLSRGALRGMWIPVSSGIFSVLLLLFGILGTFVTASPAPPLAAPTPAGAGSQLPAGGEWLPHFVLPEGFRFNLKLSGSDAVRAAGFSSTLERNTTLVHYGRLDPGDAEVLYLRFRSRELTSTWREEGEDRWRSGGPSGPEDVWLYSPGSLGTLKQAELMTSVFSATNATAPLPRPEGAGFRLADAWPLPAELPRHWANGPTVEGAAALTQKKPDPADPLSKVKVWPPLIDMLPDLRLARKAEFADGALILLGLEFKSEEARKRWQTQIPFLEMFVHRSDLAAPGGRSLFVLTRNGASRVDIGDAMRSEKQLREILARKMAEAEDR